MGGARRRKPTVKFLLDQGGVFQQSNDFGPDDLIEQILADKAAVVANRTTQFSPAIGTNTFVVVDFVRSFAWMYARRRSRTKSTTTNVLDRKSTRLNSSHLVISYAVFCLKK